METISFLLTSNARREVRNGRRYLVADCSMIVPGVLNGSQGALYYPPEEVRKNPGVWNGVALTYGHPFDKFGENTSVKAPGIEKQFRIGNVYISEVRSFKDIRRNFQQSWSNDLRNYVMGMGFLLLNIFLGLLGTFWFRTQQRRSEIALHKAHGASDINVFIRLVSEGLLLLLLVTPIAFIIDYNLANMELNSWRNGTTLEWGRLLLCAAISFVLIGLMIAIGISIPARKAMKVQPAEALHDE